MAGLANRQGMIFVDDDDDEADSAPGMTSYEHDLQRPGSPVSSSGVESEGSYAEVYSDDSYHSDGDEIAEIWDPYCTCVFWHSDVHVCTIDITEVQYLCLYRLRAN